MCGLRKPEQKRRELAKPGYGPKQRRERVYFQPIRPAFVQCSWVEHTLGLTGMEAGKVPKSGKVKQVDMTSQWNGGSKEITVHSSVYDPAVNAEFFRELFFPWIDNDGSACH
jgi:hypothetical protein